jgi:RimJ/RimL family protein N-acetyltransferase
MEYKIRKAEIEDLNQIQNLIDKLCEKEFNEFDNTINPKYGTSEKGESYVKERILDTNNSLSLVVVDNDNIVGYFLGGVTISEDYRLPNKIGEGETMFIEEEYRGIGIGTHFLKLFEVWCKEKKLNRIRLVASSKNIKAVDTYKKNGFEVYDITLEKII